MTGSIFFVLGLFVIGMLLVALEAFVIPGFGVTGVAGAVIIIYTAVHAWNALGAAWGLTLGILALFTAVAFVVWVPRSRVGRRLTLRSQIDGIAGYDEDARRAGVAVGQRGRTATPLRPSGFALFGESRVEVRTDGEWLDRGVDVTVVKLRDGKVFVELAEEAEAAPSSSNGEEVAG